MINKGSLGRRKFNSILIASAVEMVIGVLMSFIDTAVTGHVIGMNGLSAMNVIGPIMVLTVFTEGLFSVGTSTIYASYIGSYNQGRADEVFGMGIIMATMIGFLTSTVIWLLMPAYISYMGAGSLIRNLINEYLFFIYIQLCMSPVFELCSVMIFTDGGEVVGTAANGGQTVLNTVLSIILGRKMGMIGIGLATLLSTAISFLILMVHFFSKRNSLHPKFVLRWEDIKGALLYGANDSAMFFLLPISSFITTKIIIFRFGEYYLPIMTVVTSILELMVVFEATGEAMRPIMPIYVGDHNNNAIKDLLKYSLNINIVIGFAFSGIILAFGWLVPGIFDITDPKLYSICVRGLRIFAIACPGMALIGEFNSYYINVRRPRLAVLEVVLSQLVCVNMLVIPFLFYFGIMGIWIGLALNPYLTAVIFFGFIYFHYRNREFPTLLRGSSDSILNKTIRLTTDEIMGFVYESDTFLKEKKVEEKKTNRVILVLEEILVLIKDRNEEEGKNKDDLYAECCLRVNNYSVDLSIWDSGIIFDATDTDAGIRDFQSYFVTRILTNQPVKKHMVATSFNKNYFHFE